MTKQIYIIIFVILVATVGIFISHSSTPAGLHPAKLLQRGGISSYVKIGGTMGGEYVTGVKRMTFSANATSQFVAEYDKQGREIHAYSKVKKAVTGTYKATYKTTAINSPITIVEPLDISTQSKTATSHCEMAVWTDTDFQYRCSGDGYISISYSSERNLIQWTHQLASGTVKLNKQGRLIEYEVTYKDESKHRYLSNIEQVTEYHAKDEITGYGSYTFHEQAASSSGWLDNVQSWFENQATKTTDYTYHINITKRDHRGSPTELTNTVTYEDSTHVHHTTASYEYWSP